MTATWFTAMRKLLETGKPAKAYPFWLKNGEEASVELDKRDTRLVLEHGKHTQSVTLTVLEVEFEPFLAELFTQGQAFADFVKKLRLEIESTLKRPKKAPGRANLERILDTLPRKLEETMATLEAECKRLS
eukprot:TRINITY_DN8460_c0_g1_i1.p2 TRINITY_DN8460_c0_g1~~TRINITY_DN8460_c0_g1_i1.p2  ORF type:complete len:131 (-),score=31.08 TRINITY_DN8460_c0_g1_i1:78-470(-)